MLNVCYANEADEAPGPGPAPQAPRVEPRCSAVVLLSVSSYCGHCAVLATSSKSNTKAACSVFTVATFLFLFSSYCKVVPRRLCRVTSGSQP